MWLTLHSDRDVLIGIENKTLSHFRDCFSYHGFITITFIPSAPFEILGASDIKKRFNVSLSLFWSKMTLEFLLEVHHARTCVLKQNAHKRKTIDNVLCCPKIKTTKRIDKQTNYVLAESHFKIVCSFVGAAPTTKAAKSSPS